MSPPPSTRPHLALSNDGYSRACGSSAAAKAYERNRWRLFTSSRLLQCSSFASFTTRTTAKFCSTFNGNCATHACPLKCASTWIYRTASPRKIRDGSQSETATDVSTRLRADVAQACHQRLLLRHETDSYASCELYFTNAL